MDQKLYQNLMRRVPLFAELSPEEMQALIGAARLLRIKPDVTMITAGVAGTSMYMLLEGRVRVDLPVPGKGMAFLANDEGPSVIGEMALIDDGPRSATVTTTTDCVVLQIPKASFQALRSQYHPAAYKVLRQLGTTLCERLEQKTSRVVSFFEKNQLS